MEELALRFGKATEERTYPLFLDGEEVGQFKPPLSDEALEELIAHLQAPLPTDEARDWGEKLHTHGQALFKNLILDNPQVKETWEELDEEARLTLVFDKGSPELLRLPWEYMADLEGEPVAAQRPLVRRIAGLKAKKLPPLEDRPLRLLVVIAEPANLPRFDARRTYELLLEELRPLAEQGLLEIEFLPPPASPERLSTQLAGRRYDILHFICHGLRESLALEGECGEIREVKASKVRTLLRGKGIRLILLTSCLTGAVEEDLRSGVATTLVDAGIPEVVAMQFPAFVEPALKFVGDIYRAMAGEWEASIDEAVCHARRGGFFDQEEGVYQWGVPVVYLQDKGLKLFAQVPAGEPLKVKEWPEVTHNNIPHQENFVGRGQEMVKVMEALAAQRLVAVTGTGGIGKTELAKALGHYWAARGQYEGGIIWADLEQADDLNLVLSGLANALKITLDPATEPLDQLCAQLKDWPGLLILDNLDTALDGPEGDEVREALSELREGTKAPRFLITSRSMLEVDEKRFALPAMQPEEGLILFLRCAERAGAQVSVQRDWDTLIEIIRLLDNYPLPIVLAASQLKRLSPTTLLKALQDKKTEVLRLPMRMRHTRLTSLEVSLGLSYDLLSEEAQRLFSILSVFVGGVQAGSLDMILGEGWREPMAKLLHHSLVEWMQPTDRYDELVPVREYATARLPREELVGYRLKAAKHYLDLAHMGDRMLQGEQAVEATMLMELELPNMRAGMDWAGQQEDRERLQMIVRYAFNLYRFLYHRGYWGELVERLREGVKAAEILGEKRDLAGLKGNLATALQGQGQVEEARRLHEESLKIEEELGNRQGAAYTLGQLGNIHLLQSEYEEARHNYEKVLEISQELGDKSSTAKALHQLGVLAQQTGDYGEARHLYQQSLKIAEQLGDRRDAAVTVWNLGNIALIQGDSEEARRQYDESRQVFIELGDKRNLAGVLQQLGLLEHKTGDYGEARRLYQESLKIKEQLGSRSGIAISLHQLGLLAQQTGDYGEARRLYQESLKIKEQLGDRSGIASSLAQLGKLAELEEDYETAVRFWFVALQILEALGSPDRDIVLGWFAHLREQLGEEKFREIAERAQKER